ncbi:N-acetylmuramoyl-L-alanine amidase [Streptomyces sp. SID8376]|uniref:N-acetylmuramoyl-L-alanine amidase n=1 Tax=unclassified Streptomyces TaxID=2593676 RepID=UPI00036AD760|nr:N-acetylmuramoyl-L-alanine amidase [Streptomyces sp. SID8376]
MRRRAWLTLGAVLIGGGGIVTYATASPSDSGAPGQERRPVEVYGLELKGTAAGERKLPRTETEQFSLVGVSWTGALKPLEGTAQVRTRGLESGEWGAWQSLELNAAPPEEVEAGMRGASQPLWVGPSDGVEARVVHEDGTTAALPKGLEVNLVDPGVVTEAETRVDAPEPAAFVMDESPSPSPSLSSEPTASPSPSSEPTASPSLPSEATASPSPSSEPTASPSPSSEPTAPPSTVPQPPVTSRADWGADESKSPDPSEYNTDVKAVFVHHTDGANDYDCAESPAIVRGIYAYHTEVNGWNDVGYNFLVDKCGTVFEGRKGGIDRPVLGAHTYGFNRESAGIAVLGTHITGGASDAALAAVARVAAWKLGQYGADPAGTVKLTAGATQTNYFGTAFTAGEQYTFHRVSGHRDGFNTQCPGNALYAQLPTVRTWAAGPVDGLRIVSLTDATAKGSTYYTKGTPVVRWSATTPAALIKRYDVLVDGRSVAGTSGAGYAKRITLTPGSHTVSVRATHQSGAVSTTDALTVVAETTAPVFTAAPTLDLRAGTVNTGSAPVTLRWKATDDQALRQVQLLAPSTATFSAAAYLSNRTAKPGTASTWSMRAYDYAGNYGNAAATYTPVILQESAAVRTGTWSSRSSTSYLGGRSYSSASKGASLSWTFTGRSAAWVVSRASSSGQAYVYVDGVKAATVDLKSSATSYRQAIWTKTWSANAKHTVKIVVVGTSGRPTVTTDGLVYIR